MRIRKYFLEAGKPLLPKKVYAVAVKAFAEHVNIPYSRLHTYLKEPNLTDLTSFAIDKSVGTMKAYRSIVKCWLEYNDVMFTRKEMDEIKVVVKKEDKTKQEPLTIDIIRKMCDVSNLQGRALFITLLCTGCQD